MITYKQFTPIWQLDFEPTYLFSKDGKCCHNGKEIKRVYNNGCRGYYIKGKFYSLVKLRKHLTKIEKQYYPF